MNNFTTIMIDKNRGWRGLARAVLLDDYGKSQQKMVFSFSPDVWRDMLKGYMVFQTNENYLIVQFENLDRLPRPDQQRSVLIKNFSAHITAVFTYNKDTWTHEGILEHRQYIGNFKRNKNNHTTSDWNCFGIRVMPTI